MSLMIQKIADATRAASNLQRSGLAVKEALVKIASEWGLNLEQTRRVAECLNTYNTLEQFRHGEKKAEFPVVDGREVVAELFHKAASAFMPHEEPLAEYSIEVCVSAPLAFKDQIMMKRARLELDEMTARSMRKNAESMYRHPQSLVEMVHHEISGFDRAHQTALVERESAKNRIFSGLTKLAESFNYHQSVGYPEFVKTAREVHGKRAEPFLRTLSELVPAARKTRLGFHKEASLYDSGHPQYSLLNEILSAEARFVEMSKEAAAAEKAASSIRKQEQGLFFSLGGANALEKVSANRKRKRRTSKSEPSEFPNPPALDAPGTPVGQLLASPQGSGVLGQGMSVLEAIVQSNKRQADMEAWLDARSGQSTPNEQAAYRGAFFQSPESGIDSPAEQFVQDQKRLHQTVADRVDQAKSQKKWRISLEGLARQGVLPPGATELEVGLPPDTLMALANQSNIARIQQEQRNQEQLKAVSEVAKVLAPSGPTSVSPPDLSLQGQANLQAWSDAIGQVPPLPPKLLENIRSGAFSPSLLSTLLISGGSLPAPQRTELLGAVLEGHKNQAQGVEGGREAALVAIREGWELTEDELKAAGLDLHQDRAHIADAKKLAKTWTLLRNEIHDAASTRTATEPLVAELVKAIAQGDSPDIFLMANDQKRISEVLSGLPPAQKTQILKAVFEAQTARTREEQAVALAGQQSDPQRVTRSMQRALAEDAASEIRAQISDKTRPVDILATLTASLNNGSITVEQAEDLRKQLLPEEQAEESTEGSTKSAPSGKPLPSAALNAYELAKARSADAEPLLTPEKAKAQHAALKARAAHEKYLSEALQKEELRQKAYDAGITMGSGFDSGYAKAQRVGQWAGSVVSPLRDSIASMLNAYSKALAESGAALSEPKQYDKYDRLLERAKMQSAIQTVVSEDPVLRERSPRELVPILQTIAQVAPEIASHPPVLASVLRMATSGQFETLDPMTIRSLIETSMLMEKQRVHKQLQQLENKYVPSMGGFPRSRSE